MTTLQESDVRAIIADTTKIIEGDILWKRPSRKLLIQEFRAIIKSSNHPDMYLDGWFNPSSRKLSYSLIDPVEGRIYGLDFGKDHQNRGGDWVGDPHKNRWKDGERDKWAYAPPDITAPWSDPILAWRQFCAEANLRHIGTMRAPIHQEELMQ